MIEIDKPNIEIVDLSTQGSRSVGRFVVEPLERGFGTTLGNSMRRVLLSSLPGYAITSVKIDGVLHEFSTIPHVKEDVTEIVLNLKNVVLKIHDESQKTLYIKASGEGEITAGDIEHGSDVEILNPDLHIAYLDEGAEVVMELTANSGRGYVPCDRNKQIMDFIAHLNRTVSPELVSSIDRYYLIRSIWSLPRLGYTYSSSTAMNSSNSFFLMEFLMSDNSFSISSLP